MHGLGHKTIPTWDAMVTAFRWRFFYSIDIFKKHGRIQIRNVEYIGNGQEEEELLGIERDKGKVKSPDEDAENQDEFDEVSICYSFVEKLGLIPQALKVPALKTVHTKASST